MVMFSFELLFFFFLIFKLIPNMNLKISISKMFDFFSLTHTEHLHACGGEEAEETIIKSSFLASKSYQNINFDQIKNGDINLIFIYLIFYQTCHFLATHVDARS